MEIKGLTILLVISFAIGFFSCWLINNYSYEKPFGFNYSSKVESPGDFIKEEQIQVFPDKIIINIKDASIGRYAPTKSMLPVLDTRTNGIRIVPGSEDEIKVGDIISFEQGNDLIIHRVIEIGQDEQGKYFITKGDNNNISDGKIRFSQIKYKTIALIY